jgi:DNA-binding CsgD family transcriptional regulator
MKIKYKVSLTKHEIERLKNILKGNFSKRIKLRAEILIRINNGQSYRDISEILNISQNTISNTLERYTSGGIDFVMVARNNVF